MLPSGKYLRCQTCGKLFPEGCARQLTFLAKCDTCKFKEEENKKQVDKTERNK